MLHPVYLEADKQVYKIYYSLHHCTSAWKNPLTELRLLCLLFVFTFFPQFRNRLTDFDEIRILELSCKDHPPRSGLGENLLSCRFLFLSLFFGLFVTRTGRTGEPILTIYKLRIWRLSAQGYAFLGGFVDMPPQLGGQIPKTPILGAWVVVFQPSWWNRQELIKRWDSERELLRSAPGSYPSRIRWNNAK